VSALGLALRALWWRRGVSLTVLAIAAFVAAAASAGPMYLRAAGESILQDGLQSAPSTSTGAEVRQQGSYAAGQLAQLQQIVAEARTGLPYYGEGIGAVEVDGSVVEPDGSSVASTRVAARTAVCEQIEIVRGRCPATVGEIVISADTSSRHGWTLGRALSVTGVVTDTGPRPLRVVGVYRPIDPTSPYWFSRAYFASTGANQGVDDDRVDAFFTVEPTFSGLAATTPVTTLVDLPLRTDRVSLADTDDVRAGLARLRERLAGAGPQLSVDSGVLATVGAAERAQEALRVPVLLVVLQLLVLSWIVLFMVVAGSAEARAGEIALAKARGLSPGATVAFGLLETLVLLVLSVPLGLLLGFAGVRAMASTQLATGAPVRIVPLALAAAGVAAAGGLVAAGLAASRTLRTPVLDLWRRATNARQAGRRSVAADGIVLALATAGLAQLLLGGSLDGDAAVISLLAPGLLALGVALVGARLLPVLCRALFSTTRASRRVGTFLGLRQVARRPSGLRVVVILTIAFGLATFSVLGWTVLARNRADRAHAETGAAVALAVDAPAGVDLLSAVRAADPTGRHAMAAVLPEAASSARLLLGVDSERLPAVAFWRPDFASADLSAIASQLRPPAPPPVLVRGEGVGVRLAAVRLAAAGPVRLEADVQLPGGRRVTVPLGALTPGPARDFRGRVEGCTGEPCRLVRVRVARPLTSVAVTGTLVLEEVQQLAAGRWQPLADPGFGDRARWRSLNRGDYAPADTLLPGTAGLRFDFSAPADSSVVGVAPVDAPVVLPALVTDELITVEGGSRTLELTGLDRSPVTVEAVATAAMIPRAGRSAALVDLDYLQRQTTATFSAARREVWLTPDAPEDRIREVLADRGVVITGERRASVREDVLARQAPSLALLLFLVGAGIAAVLAAAGTVLDVYLLGRRRSYELAAMLAIGVRRRTLVAGVLVEQALLIGTGTLLGVGVGYLGARVALPSVPLYTDRATFPSPLFEPDVTVVAAMVGGVVVVMTLAVVTAALLLVRAAVPSRLREVQA
jgi:putative ABC transport system permease protein